MSDVSTPAVEDGWEYPADQAPEGEVDDGQTFEVPGTVQTEAHSVEADPVQDPISTEAPEVAAGTDAAGADAEEGEPVENATVRRSRGWLASDVKTICDQFITGALTLGEGESLTPHRISRAIKDSDSLDKAPSTGAVANVLKRWAEIGFAQISPKPLAFVDYTDEGRNQGLTALDEAFRTDRKAEKAAAKAAAVPAPVEEAPAPTEASDQAVEPAEASGEVLAATDTPEG